MRQKIMKMACSALVGAAIAGSALVGSAQAQTAGSMTVPLTAGTTETATQAQTVNHRRSHRRHYRNYRHHRRGGGGVYFDFGNGSFSLQVPPRRYHPRYERRYYTRPVPSGSRHVRWCYSRYKTYRAYDNTFQPYHGPRRQCRSPYY